MTNWFDVKCERVSIKLGENGNVFQLLLIFLWLVCPKTAFSANLYEPDEFGTSQSEPIDKSFFFHEGKYIESPYVIERRGLDLYINDILLESGPKWALYDYKVETDPGDPPQGSHPLDKVPDGTDVRDTYWFKKWGYLYSHYDFETAKKMMCDTYKKSTEIKDAYFSDTNTVCIIHKRGKKELIDLSLAGGGFAIKQPSKEDLIKQLETNMKFYEGRLNGNVVFCMKGGLSIVAGGQRALDVVEILLSDKDDDTKFKALQEADFLHPGRLGEIARWIVTDFEATPQLKERFNLLKANSKANPVVDEVNDWLDQQDADSLNSMPLTSIEGIENTLIDQQANDSTSTSTNQVEGTRDIDTKSSALRLKKIGLVVVGISIAIGLVWHLRRRVK